MIYPAVYTPCCLGSAVWAGRPYNCIVPDRVQGQHVWGIMLFSPAWRDALPKGSMSSLPLMSSAVSDTTTHLHTSTSVTTAISSPVITETAVEQVTGTSSAPLCNLLRDSGMVKESAGIYMGEGLLPVPAKLAEKIIHWEFVEIQFWTPSVGNDLPPLKTSTHRQKRAVTDITTWVQCLPHTHSVMSGPHSIPVPELLAYLILILRASQDFGSVAWVTYYAAFRRHAFITGKLNPSLYSICFVGGSSDCPFPPVIVLW